MLEETQILAKSVDALEKLSTKTNSHLMLLNNVCHKNKRGQRFLIEDLNLHRRLVHLSTKAKFSSFFYFLLEISVHFSKNDLPLF
jgi:hypothetical protein